MVKLLKKLVKLSILLGVLAVVGCVYFYINRKEHFNSIGDFFEELMGTLSTLPVVAVILP